MNLKLVLHNIGNAPSKIKNGLKSFLCDEDKRIFRFSVFLGAIYFTQATGTTGGLAGNAIQFFLKEGLGYSATTLAYITSITTLAWWIKPGFGLMSDMLPIRGYRVVPYIYICNSLSILLWWSLAGMAYSETITTYWPIAIVAFFMGFNFAITDVVGDKLMVVTGQETENTGRFQAVQWGTIRFAIMLTTILGVALALWAMPDTGLATFKITSTIHHRIAVIFLLASIFPFVNIAAAYHLAQEEKVQINRAEVWSKIKSALKMRPIWILGLCIFGLNFSPGWGTPFFYYLRDYCGPNHGQMGKMTFAYISTFESGVGIIGCIAFWKYCKEVNFRKLVYFSILLGAFASIFYLWVQDVRSLLIIAGIFGPIAAFLNLVYLDILAKNCPKLAEGFIYAGLTSIVNLSASASSAFGGWMYGKLEGDRYITIVNEMGEAVKEFIPAGPWFEWGWSWTSWLTDLGVSQYMVGLRPLIIVSALFTLVTILLVPLMKLDDRGRMGYKESEADESVEDPKEGARS